MISQAPEPPSARQPSSASAERKQLVGELELLIYGGTKQTARQRRSKHLLRDHTLRRRTEAVEVLGRFPEREAAAALADLVLHGEWHMPGPDGRWLADTALLTMLRAHALSRRAVSATLLRLCLGYLPPWRWSRAYDNLPLLAHYGKLWVFFLGFWLWWLLILGVPTVMFAHEFVEPVDRPLLQAWLIIIGTGLELYLVHQVLVALLVGKFGPLRIPGGAGVKLKLGVTLLLGLASSALLVVARGIIISECYYDSYLGVNVCADQLHTISLIQPLLLLPLFILTRDLEQAVRYLGWREGLWQRGGAFILRRATELIYVLFVPTVAAAISTIGLLRNVLIPYLLYLFIAPFVFVAVVWLIAAGGSRLMRRNSRPELPK